MIVHAWQMLEVGEPMIRIERKLEHVGHNDVAIRVAGCGLCSADLGYLFGSDRPGHPLPLTLGHEVAGTVIETGRDAAEWLGRPVVVPALIPCNQCEHCLSGQDRSCLNRTRVGCDIHGGFASHIVVPTRGLCAVEEDALASSGVPLSDLAALVEAVSTPYEAIARSRLVADDVAIVVGVGGIGAFGVQIASVLDAHVIALDTNDDVLEDAVTLGAMYALNIVNSKPAAVRRAVSEYVREAGIRDCCWKVFEMSQTASGMAVAFELLTTGGQLAIVGCQCDEVTVRLSNLITFDATVRGVSGCRAEHYPEALDLILAGDVKIAPFSVRRPMSSINEIFARARGACMSRRPILVPDFD